MKSGGVKGGRLPDFKERLDELRGEMSNTEFAEFLEMSRQTIGFYLNGDRIPDALVLRQIAEKCHVSTDWLLGLSNIRTMSGELRQVCDYTGLSEKSVVLLNDSKYKGSPWNLWAGLVDNILEPGCIYKYSRNAWRAAIAEVQAKRSEITRDDSKMEERRMLDDKIAKAVLADKADGLITEISVYDAARFYRDRAIASVENGASNALYKYVDLMKKAALEENDEPEQDNT